MLVVRLVTKLRLSTLFGLAVFLAASGPAGASDILVPAKTPFGYNVGIAYETDIDGRTGRSITADLNQITQYFELVRTYHDIDLNSTTLKINPDEMAVIQYAVTHPAMSLVMGTYNSAVVMGTTGNFSAGLMDSSTYTDAWVQMLIGAFGSTAAVEQSLKTILLGNELDFPASYTPGPTDPSYSAYVNTWIPTALANLKSSLSKVGLDNIPVSVTLAYSAASPLPAGDTVSTAIPLYISNNWSASWNGGAPFVLYDSYPNPSQPTWNEIVVYLQDVVESLNGQNEVFLGETGVQSSGSDDTQEAVFYHQMFAFLGAERRLNGGLTLPVFAFQAFDLPAENQSYGLFSQDAGFQPTGLKPCINIPSWVAQPINVAQPANTGIADTHDFNGDGCSDIAWRDSSGDNAMWLMNGGTILSSAGLGTISTAWSIVGQRDFNGDGMADWLWRDTSGDLAIWFLNGLTVTSGVGLGTVTPVWSIVATGDFNGDGKGDILWRDTSGDIAMWLMNGSTILSSAGLGSIPTSWSVVGTGDFNGDGNWDILWQDTSGDLAIWFMNGTTVSSGVGLGTIVPPWTIVATGDFNGDGKSDILWRNTSTGAIAVWLMNGSTILSSAGLGSLATTWSVVETGDFNGDGMSDILWTDTSGDVAIWFMNGGQMLSPGVVVGTVPTVWTVQGLNAD